MLRSKNARDTAIAGCVDDIFGTRHVSVPHDWQPEHLAKVVSDRLPRYDAFVAATLQGRE
jgi:hypothetical protein